MSELKVAKQIDFYINIKYKIIDEKIHQIFEFNTSNKKYLAYAYDSRYLLKRKLEELIRKEALDGYIDRIDEKNYI